MTNAVDTTPLSNAVARLAEGLERYAEVNQGRGDKVILLP